MTVYDARTGYCLDRNENIVWLVLRFYVRKLRG